MAMTLQQISAFREVMRAGSVSDAARTLLRTQPAISAQIKALEADLNCPLFERKGRRLVPLPEAHYLLREADEILSRMEVLERNMHDLNNQVAGELSLVAMPGATVELLPELVAQFVTQRPKTEISIISRTSPQVEQMMATQNFDIGLADAVFDTAPGEQVVRHELFDLSCYCALPVSDPLARRATVTPEDLVGRALGCLNDDHPTTIQLRHAFDAAGATFNRRFRTRYFVPLFRLIEQGHCFALVDALARETYMLMREGQGRLAFVPFAPRINLTVSLMTPAHRPLSQLAQSFREALAQRLAAL